MLTVHALHSGMTLFFRSSGSTHRWRPCFPLTFFPTPASFWGSLDWTDALRPEPLSASYHHCPLPMLRPWWPSPAPLRPSGRLLFPSNPLIPRKSQHSFKVSEIYLLPGTVGVLEGMTGILELLLWRPPLLATSTTAMDFGDGDGFRHRAVGLLISLRSEEERKKSHE